MHKVIDEFSSPQNQALFSEPLKLWENIIPFIFCTGNKATTRYVRIDRRFQPQSNKSMLTIKPTFVIRMIIVKGRKKNEARKVALYIAKQNAKNTRVQAKQTENC